VPVQSVSSIQFITTYTVAMIHPLYPPTECTILEDGSSLSMLHFLAINLWFSEFIKWLVVCFINLFLFIVRTIPTQHTCTGLLLQSCHHFSLMYYQLWLILYLCSLLYVISLRLVHVRQQEMAGASYPLLPSFIVYFF
jgi:hypothetical protein